MESSFDKSAFRPLPLFANSIGVVIFFPSSFVNQARLAGSAGSLPMFESLPGIAHHQCKLRVIQKLTAFHVGRLLLHKPKINCLSVGWGQRFQSALSQEYWFEDEHFRVVGACRHCLAAVAENRNAKASPIIKGEPVSVGTLHRVNTTHHLSPQTKEQRQRGLIEVICISSSRS